MSNILLAVICLAIGKALQNTRNFPESSAQVLNSYVIYIALPALILVRMPTITFDANVIAPVLIAWMVMALSALATWRLAKFLKWDAPTTGALLLVVTLGNTSFIGIPLIEAHLGVEAIPYAILYDQLGTFLALNTLGIAIASRYSQEQHLQSEPLWLKMVKFPPFSALLCGLVLALSSVTIPSYLFNVLQRLEGTLVPVVMVAVGLQWRLRMPRTEFKLIAFALVLILVVKPVLALVLVRIFTLEPLVAKTIVLEAAMPAMISTSVLAAAYGLAPRLVSAIIGYSLMFAFLTVWGWSWVI